MESSGGLTFFQGLEKGMPSGGFVTTEKWNKQEKKMATNPIGKGTKTIGINMSSKMAQELETRSSSMQISTSNYVKIILKQWLDSGKKLTLSE